MPVSPTAVRPGGYRTGFSLLLLLLALAVASSVRAAGWAPFARDDQALVTRGGTVTVLQDGASSVLQNDFDIEGDKLSAQLTGEPKEGFVQLNDDGTFSYTHNGNNKNKDEFSYRAFDGTAYSREARVRIDIVDVPNTPPYTVGSPGAQVAVDGALFQLALAEYFGDVDANDSLQFSASGLPAGNRLRIDSNSGLLSGTPNAADVRDAAYTIRITATDNAGASASLDFGLTIYARDRADLELTASVAINPVTVGESAQWDITIKNRGPANLDTAELVAQWATSGPNLSLLAPPDCNMTANNSKTPELRCSIIGLPANNTLTFHIPGTQDGAGDNSLLAVVVADDPNLNNNAMLTGAVVVAAFSEGPTQTINASGNDVASGDLNGDGAQDLVVSSSETVVFFNTGKRTVTTPGRTLGADSGGNAVVLLDWNGDGNLDIAVAGMSSRAGRIYLNDGNGNFASSVDLDVGGLGTVNAAAASDFDQDGDDELILAGSSKTLLVGASGVSGFASSSLPAASGIDASVADINSDGLDDIIVVQAGNRLVSIMRNSGDGKSFGNQTLSRGSVSAATPQDMDRDGYVDLLLAVDAGALEVPQSKVVYQQADGSFSSGSNLGASPLSEMLSGDIDKDGVPDVIAINASGVHQVYRGLPSGGFSLNAEQIVSDGMQRGVLVDFNGDDSLDLIVAGAASNVVEIHANNGIGRLGLGDRVAPLITLNGAAALTLAAGEAYEELGATASDDIDGDLTDRIIISGAVNTTVVGSYTVTYTAVDNASNTGVVKRTVQVGVNQGTGGSGGGATGPLFLIVLVLLAALRRDLGFEILTCFRSRSGRRPGSQS